MFKCLKDKRIAQLKELQLALHLIKKGPLTLTGLIIMFLLVLVAIFAPYITPYPQDALGAVSPENKFEPPSREHLFGTDELGRDIFSRVLFGTRISFKIAIVVVVLALLIGLPLGVIGGFLGGKIDELIMRLTDIFLSFPSVLLALIICVILGPSIDNMVIAIAISWWPWYTRIAHAQAVSIRERPFIEAAKAVGISKTKIIFRHIMPNSLTPVLVQATMDLGSVLLTSSALSFLGLGAQPPQPEWGLMTYIGHGYLFTSWWCSTFPGLAIFVAALAFNLLGDGLRDVLDPRTRRLLR
jgi:peptide/nickel transport system permease protein